MSKRRNPYEIVRRRPGSGFVASAEPTLVRVPEEPAYTDEADPCMLCDDPACREWANLEIINGPHAGSHMYHISECEMTDHI